jgi:hypothetical protein
MTNQKEEAFDEMLQGVGYKYQVGKYYFQKALCAAITVLIWGGAVWFGSLGWPQKQGSVFFVMGFGVWLLIFKLIAPGLWWMSKEMMLDLVRWLKSYIFKRIG